MDVDVLLEGIGGGEDDEEEADEGEEPQEQ